MIEAMPGWDRIYSDEQREAVAVAYIDQRIRPAHRVVALAKAGNLFHGDSKLPAFDIAENTVRSYGAQLVKSRKGELKSALTNQEPRDALETIRRRLLSAMDHELRRVEITQKQRNNTGTVDPERLRQLARAARELAAIPGRNDSGPVIKPGARAGGSKTRDGGKTTGGLAGQILHAHRRTGGPSPEEGPTPHVPAAALQRPSHDPYVESEGPDPEGTEERSEEAPATTENTRPQPISAQEQQQLEQAAERGIARFLAAQAGQHKNGEA